MTQNLDIEWILAGVFVAFVQANISSGIITASQIVTWMDPMAVDEADRVIVTVPDGQSEDYMVANGQFNVEIGVKTQFAQATLQDQDVTKHRSRVIAVRSLLWTDTLIADLTAAAAGAMGFNFIQPQRSFKSQVMAQNLWSETGLRVDIFSTIT